MLALKFVNLKDGADVGMVQRRRRTGFPLQAVERLLVVLQLLGQKLESNVASELEVFGFVDHAHTAAAEHAKDFVVRESLPNHAMPE